MAFGITNSGFVLKRLEDIKADVESGLREAFGEINTGPDSVFGQHIGVFSRQLAEVWEEMELVYNSQYPNTADGVALDNSSGIVGVIRLPAVSTTVVVQMEGTEGTPVPAAREFAKSSDAETFKTLAAATITNLKLHRFQVSVDDYTQSFAYTITIDGFASSFIPTPPFAAGVFDQEFIARNLSFAINANTNINTKVLAGHSQGDNFLTIRILTNEVSNTFTGTVGSKLTVDAIWSPVNVIADNAGRVPAPVDSINTINTPVSGLSQVSNQIDGVTGQPIETDPDFRIRRKLSLEVIAAATVGAIRARLIQDLTEVSSAFVFENRDDIYTGNGVALTVFDSDFVTGNSIVYKVNDETASAVPFNTDHDTTMADLKSAIEALTTVLSVVLTDLSGDNRKIEVTTIPFTTGNIFRIKGPEVLVSGGASQPASEHFLSNTGLPPHSFEAVVAALDEPAINQAIGDKIFEVKPAGIQSHGANDVDVTDSNGEVQVMRFTRAKTKFVFVELDYNRSNADDPFPLDGETQIANEILRIGDGLTFGNDLLIQVFEAAGYIARGVTLTAVRLAVKDDLIDPLVLQTVNIKLKVSELPTFDLTRITLLDVTPP